MIYYDMIIRSLQPFGGITVYHNELLRWSEKYGVKYQTNLRQQSALSGFPSIIKKAQLFIRVGAAGESGVFHSSYYRVPDSRTMGMVVTVHDLIHEKIKSGMPNRLMGLVKNRALRRADRIICVSENTKKDLLECYGIPDVNIRVIHNGVNPIYRNDGTWLRQLDRCEVLFVGARDGYKNFYNAIVAAGAFRDMYMRIVGGGDLSLDEVQLLERELPGRYCFEGQVSDVRLKELYSSVTCLVYPSIYEGFGIPVLEAMAAGCPVIAVNVSSIPEISGGAAALIPDGSVESIKCGYEMLRDPIKLGRMSEDGIKNAERFSWEKTFLETLAVYRELDPYI